MNAPLTTVPGDIGTWTVLGPTDRKNDGGNRLWRVRCKCGAEYERTGPQIRAAPHCRACADAIRRPPGHAGTNHTPTLDADTEAAVLAALREGATTAQVMERWPRVTARRCCALREEHGIARPKATPIRVLDPGTQRRLEAAIRDGVEIGAIVERFRVDPKRVKAIRLEMEARR